MSASDARRARRADRKRCNCGDNFGGDVRQAPPGIQRAARVAVDFLDACDWPPPAPVLLLAQERGDGSIALSVGALSEARPALTGRARSMVEEIEGERVARGEHVVLLAIDAAEHRMVAIVAGNPAKRVNVRGERGQA